MYSRSSSVRCASERGNALPWFQRETVSGRVPSRLATSTERMAAFSERSSSFLAITFACIAEASPAYLPGHCPPGLDNPIASTVEYMIDVYTAQVIDGWLGVPAFAAVVMIFWIMVAKSGFWPPSGSPPEVPRPGRAAWVPDRHQLNRART